ncbi:MAG: RdgB/HAM1 family non-canonical purine NTP pyrophosphatase [Microscillaceae bacterium]|nr:RdgB/HAM1 family non-canonical purine NTP pyrophosphatase [Microscillaceae bacterium]MDW8461522.1 RdgB/HAM1 family non-canonical purine NTP pyrophosphatase [Cytophagales bacterium]
MANQLPTLCFASHNAGKIAEMRALLANHFHIIGLNDIGCHEELPETNDTIAGNSAQKAMYVWQNYQIACFADDSGLEVEALDGAPGVHSAYYAGLPKDDKKNITLLLKNLHQHSNRNARFVCVISLIQEGTLWQFEGEVKGTIIDTPRGINGFGYDPIFVPQGYMQTFAEMDKQTKNLISHRGQAIQKMIALITQKLF